MTIDEFKKVDLRVAKIRAATRVEGSEKLLKLTLEAGDKDASGAPLTRQILAGIGKFHEPDALIGREIVIVANLEPRMMMGEESNGMLLAAAGSEGPVILMPAIEVEPGSPIG